MHFDPNMRTILTVLCLLLLLAVYVAAACASNRRHRRWPHCRIGCWLLGLLCFSWSVAGPISSHAHHSFASHMLVHLLLGMLSPLFIALAKPVTLLLRTVGRKAARSVSRLLRSRPFAFISSPITASVLHVGGLWLLYGTELYGLMHAYSWLYVLVHIHLFAAGYLFTVSILQLEPSAHPRSLPYRMTVFMLASAAHAVLAKSLYAHPPVHVTAEDAASGSMLMYYGGDLAELIMLTLLFSAWYRARTRRLSASIVHAGQPPNPRYS